MTTRTIPTIGFNNSTIQFSSCILVISASTLLVPSVYKQWQLGVLEDCYLDSIMLGSVALAGRGFENEANFRKTNFEQRVI